MEEQKKFELSFIGKLFESVGRLFLKTTPGKLAKLFFQMVESFFVGNKNFKTDTKNFILQIFFTGVELFPVLCIVAVIFGTVVIFETISLTSRMGFGDVMGNVLTIVIIRELGPIFTAFLIAGRSGSALASLIGNMQLNLEVDALATMGINPIRYLMMPALLGGTVAVFIMNICFSFCAICGGYFIAKTAIGFLGQLTNVQLTWQFITTSILSALSFTDFLLLIIKPIIFGIIIVVNACYQGLRVDRDVRNLPKATSRSVIYSFLYIVIADAILSVFYIFEYLEEISKII